MFKIMHKRTDWRLKKDDCVKNNNLMKHKKCKAYPSLRIYFNRNKDNSCDQNRAIIKNSYPGRDIEKPPTN